MAIQSDEHTEAILADGVVSVRELAHNTTRVLKALEDRKRPVLVTRHGRVVAVMAPISMREVVDRVVANESDLRDRMTMAEKNFSVGETLPISDLMK